MSDDRPPIESMPDDLIPARILIDVGIEEVDASRNSELTRIADRWAKEQEYGLRARLRAYGFDAEVRSQAADYER